MRQDYERDRALLESRTVPESDEDMIDVKSVNQLKNRIYRDHVRDLVGEREAVGYLTPGINRMVAGNLLNSVTAKRYQWTSARGVMPGAWLSSVQAYWTDPRYAELRLAEMPQPGRVRILWNDGQPDGFCFAPSDVLSPLLKHRSGGGDQDDLLIGIAYQEGESPVRMWFFRNPVSWGDC